MTEFTECMELALECDSEELVRELPGFIATYKNQFCTGTELSEQMQGCACRLNPSIIAQR